ncbi:MAG: tRNA pseudouridine(38-40) synthase TruA, partial [Ignavibacteria bacterium]|nr:tRNA pseudouridine(38-40) synthase TruA [Ignavibacteria bacterium]
LAYNGKNYHGWQSQQNAHSVQDEIEKCLSLKLNEQIRVTGCGRTDTGVHSRDFYAHFDTLCQFNLNEASVFIHQLNQFLPQDIVVYEMIEVVPEANARFDAISRTYNYYISRNKNPFDNETSYYVYGNLNVNLMQKAANILFDYEDFTSFSKLHSQTKTNNCSILEAQWTENESGLIFEITANRFLRNMVRAIVGTLLEVGKGKISVNEFRSIIEQRNRNKAGFSVPAHALFLQKVAYPEEIFVKI